jgi:hypothetical protein
MLGGNMENSELSQSDLLANEVDVDLDVLRRRWWTGLAAM